MSGAAQLATLRCAVAIALALAVGAIPAQAAEPPAGFAGLSPEQRAFVDDPAVLRHFGMTREKLHAILARQDAPDAQLTITAMMETMNSARFRPLQAPQPPGQSQLDPVGDMPEVPLNPAAGSFNAATVLRPAILDEVQRTPGPFSLHRYLYEQDAIPTFADAPVAIRKEDLVAGKVEVAFVGVPIDLGSGWRDSQNAPNALRAMYGTQGFDIYAGIDPAVQLSIVDYGDLSVDKMSVEMTVDHVRRMVGEMVDANVVPFIVGGDHSVLYPTVAAFADRYGKGKVGIVQLDAHYDGARDLAHTQSDEQSVSRLVQDGIVEGRNIVEVGLRDPELKAEDLGWMREQGVRYHTMAEVESRGWEKVLAATLQEVRNGPENVVVAFDISVLDPAYASGAGRPAPGGLTMREAVPLVRRICAETKVVGFEMLDVAPYLDLSYATALNANSVMHACLTGIAMRKGGIKDPNYLSPLTLGSGR